MAKRKKSKMVKGTWSKDEVKKLKKIFRNNPTKKVAKELNRPLDAVKKKASRIGLTKTKKYLKTLGRK